MKKQVEGSVITALIAFISVIFGFTPAHASGQQGLTLVVRLNNQIVSPPPPYDSRTNNSNVCYTGVVSNIDFNWGATGPVGCQQNWFSTYFYGYIKAPITGTVNFYDIADDGFYLEINGKQVISNWTNQGPSNPNSAGSFNMVKDQVYPIKVWHYQWTGSSEVHLLWNTSNNDFNSASIIPTSSFATDPNIWGVTYMGNSMNANNSVGSSNSSSPATSTSNGAGLYQNAVMR